MPFEYKSLAQLQPSPAKAPEIFNLVKNPSFDSCSLRPWRMSTDSRSSSTSIRFFRNEQLITTASTNPGFTPTTWAGPRAAQFSASDSRPVAIWTGWDPYRSLTRPQICPYPEDLVPARGKKQMYSAFSLMRWSSNTASNYLLRVYEWDADYTFVSQKDLNFSSDYGWISQDTNKWQRVWTTFTTEEATQYLSFSLFKTAADNIYHMFTDLYVGESREYAEAPFNSLTQDLTFNYPFDKRRFGYIGEYGNSYTGKSFAGPLELIYTTPAQRSVVISSILVNNVGKVDSPYRIAIIPNGRTLSQIELSDFITFDEISKVGESYNKAQGITLSSGDKLYVAADSGAINFNVFGAEVY